MKYLKNLDGVRGLAILLVFLFHYLVPFEFGWVGVQLFFVLSGFLITSILLEDKSNNLGLYLKRFYWRRTLRIFPLYYAYLFMILGVYLVFNSPTDFLERAPYLFTYTYNYYPLVSDVFERDTFFIHFWSLSIEEQFYLFWPVIVYFFSQRQLRVIVIGMIIICPLFRFWFAEYLAGQDVSISLIGQIVYRMTPSQLDSFAFGAMIPVFGVAEYNARVLSRGALFSLFALIMAGFCNYIFSSVEIPFSSMGYPIGGISNLQHVWSYTLIAGVSMFLIAFCMTTSNRVVRMIFESKVMVSLGKYSYGLYVYHWIISMVFRVYLEDKFVEPIGFILYSLSCMVVAVISYRLLERPFLMLKDKLYMKSENIQVQG